MAKAIFTAKPDSKYDDLLESCYHFPETYIRAVESALSDWIIYYEPRRPSEDRNSTGGRSAYFATARIVSIEKDPKRNGYFYAYVSDYLEFDRAVPFREGNYYYEAQLKKDDGKTNKGAFGRAVRNITDQEYDNILKSGFDDLFADLHQQEYLIHEPLEELEIFKRPLVKQIVTRPFRDAAFSKQVKKAYNETCAVTGIKIVNGGNRPEVQAAHIWPVHRNGPDSVRNGIALSSTIHWIFDRGLISIEDDYSVLIANDRVPDAVTRLINPRIQLPKMSALRPHHKFLQYHRENIFKG